MNSCCIPNCTSNFKTENVSYFQFPLHDAILLEKWIKQIGIPELKPEKTTEICSKHFLDSDIDNHPNRKNPILKPTAVPIPFSGSFNNLEKESENIVTVLNQLPAELLIPDVSTNSVEKEINFIPSIMHAASVVSSPVIVEQLPIIETNFVPVPVTPPRFRTILPKLDSNSNDQMPLINQSPKRISPKAPCFIIIPAFNNTKLSPPKNMSEKMLNINGVKKPVLRITVIKKYKEPDKSESDNENEETKDVDSPGKTIEIRNNKLNRLVIFSLDPITGEMLVEKRQIRKKAIKNKKTKQSKKVNASKAETYETLDHLKDFCMKSEENCNGLKKRLRVLRDKHKQEQMEICNLKNQFFTIDNNSESKPEKNQKITKSRKRKIEIEDPVEVNNDMNNRKVLKSGKKFKKQTQSTVSEINRMTSENLINDSMNGLQSLIFPDLKNKKPKYNIVLDTDISNIKNLTSTVLKAE